MDGENALTRWLAEIPAESPSGSAVDLRGRAQRVAGAAEAAGSVILDQRLRWIDALQTVNGFNAHEAARALDLALASLRADDLTHVWDTDLSASTAGIASLARVPRLAVVFGGGAIPQPNIRAVVAAAMIAPRTLYRPPASDPALGPAFAAELNRALPEAGIFSATWPREREDLTRAALTRADSFTLFGDARTAGALRPMLPATAQTFIHGPRQSVAALDLDDPESSHPSPRRCPVIGFMRRFADDIAAYDQRGCLSPVALYLIGGTAAQRDRALDTLALELDQIRAERGAPARLSASAATRIQTLRALWSMEDPARRRLRCSADLPGWTLLWDGADSAPGASPGYQTLKVIPVESWRAFTNAVTAEGQTALQGLGVAPDPTRIPEPELARLQQAGAAWICKFGEMQNPPLDWRHDGCPIIPWRAEEN